MQEYKEYKDAFGEELKEKDKVIYITKTSGKRSSDTPFKKGIIQEFSKGTARILKTCLYNCIENCEHYKNRDKFSDFNCYSHCTDTVLVPLKYIVKIKEGN